MEASGLVARMRRGLGGQSFAQAVGFAIQLVSLPVLLAAWGAELYGEWLILFTVPAYLGLVDVGLTTAGINQTTMLASGGDRDGARAAFQTAWLLVTVISGVAAVLLLLLSGVVPFIGWLGVARMAGRDVVFAVLLAYALLKLQSSLLSMGLIAVGKYGAAYFIAGAERVVSFGPMIAAAAAGYGPVTAALCLLAGQAVSVGVMWLAVRRSNDWLAYGVGGATRSQMATLLKPSLGYLGFTVGNVITLQTPILIIGIWLGPAATPLYVALRMVARTIYILAAATFAVVRPEIAAAYGRGDVDLLRLVHMRVLAGALWFGAAACAGLLLIGTPLVAYWTDGALAVEQPLFVLLLASTLATVLWNAGGSVHYATNQVAALSRTYLAASVCAIGGAVLLLRPLGVEGVVLAQLCGEAFLFAYVLVASTWLLEFDVGALLRGLARPPVGAIVALWRSP